MFFLILFSLSLSFSKIHQRNQQPSMTMTQRSILFLFSLSLDNWIAERQEVENEKKKEENSPIKCNSRLHFPCPHRCDNLEQLFEWLVVSSKAIDVRLSQNNLSLSLVSFDRMLIPRWLHRLLFLLCFTLALIFIQSTVQIHICARIHTMK